MGLSLFLTSSWYFFERVCARYVFSLANFFFVRGQTHTRPLAASAADAPAS